MEVPVIATAVGGSSEAVQDGRTGLLVSPQDSTALALAIERLISDGDTRKKMGQMGRTLIKERFTQRGMRAATGEVFKSVQC